MFGNLATNLPGAAALRAATIFAALLPQAAGAQCDDPDWIIGPQQGARGVLGGLKEVHALTNWDPDGDGPQSPVLIVAGDFRIAGTEFANSIASWDGDAWRPLAGGVDGAVPRVRALAVYDGDLIAAGEFTLADGTPVGHIARWDGSAWHPLGGGLSGDQYAAVHAMTLYQGDLVAAGDFFLADGQAASNIARWNGSSWSPIGAGFNAPVRALIEHNGALVAGGEFTQSGGIGVERIAQWNGEWAPLGGGVGDNHKDSVMSLADFGGDLVAAGLFLVAGDVAASCVARWDGSAWHALGTGVNTSAWAAFEFDGALFIGGEFTRAGEVEAAHVARWSGSEWQAVGDLRVSVDLCFALDSFDGELIAAGDEFIRPWNGAAWSYLSPGITGGIEALVSHGDDLIAAGRTTSAGNLDGVNAIARWDGADWFPMGGGFTEAVAGPPVEALAVYKDDVIAAGNFKRADDHAGYGYIARWDGAAWKKMDTGFSSGVRALAPFGEDLIAGGPFERAGDTQVDGMARWDGAHWTKFGTECPVSVLALAVYNGDLIAGGQGTGLVYRWDGAQWQLLGAGLRGGEATPRVYALAVYDGDLIATGSFSRADEMPALNIARWNGAAWTKLGSGLDGEVGFALAVHGADLYVAGAFDSAGGLPAHDVARWDGAAWHPLGLGIDAGLEFGNVRALASHNDEVVAGGYFSTAGHRVSAFWARWGCEPADCYADFTGDGALDLFDFLAFVNAFNAQDPAADCDQNQSFDLFDFLCFTNAFNAGC